MIIYFPSVRNFQKEANRDFFGQRMRQSRREYGNFVAEKTNLATTQNKVTKRILKIVVYNNLINGHVSCGKKDQHFDPIGEKCEKKQPTVTV